MELSFLGATRTVTGSCYLLTVGDRRVMVDCGLYQGLPELSERNYTHPGCDWSKVDAILLTHAHIDHSGLIPRAVRQGYRGPVYAHPATIDLSGIMFRDSADIHERNSGWLNRKRARAGKAAVEPLYTKRDAANAMKRFRPAKYGEPFEVVPGIKAEFRDAGHILGSASIAIDCTEGAVERRIVFSGDVGNHMAPILREPEGFEHADAVLIETTYGNRIHETHGTRRKMLTDIVRKADRISGKVVIPAFTVGRTQELLYILGELLEEGKIPSIPIVLDSPMAIRATEVHQNHPECFDKETHERIRAGENPFYPPNLRLTRTVHQSKSVNRIRGAAIIIAGSGMCEGGRIVHHLKHNLYDPATQVVFVGYQAAGTLGRIILGGKKKVRLFREEIAVRAKITAIGAFSAHADSAGLIDWLGKFSDAPEVTFLVHGEERSSEDFGEVVREKIGYTTYLPRLGQTVDLVNLDRVVIGKRRFIKKPVPTPSVGDVREIVARVSTLGEEFRGEVENYVAALGNRIQKAAGDGAEPQWQTQDVAEILEHMSEAVGGDVDRLKAMIDAVPE